MKLSKEGLKIAYYPLDEEVCRRTLEALAEGVVLANMIELEAGAPNFVSLVDSKITYEPPQQDCARDQEIGTLSAILHKRRATCLEAAAVEAAVQRASGRMADVYIEYESDANGNPIPWSYHAFVRFPNTGEVTDPSAELTGSPQVGGPRPPTTPRRPDARDSCRPSNCCESCALDNPCEGECDGDDGHHHHHDETDHAAVGGRHGRTSSRHVLMRGRRRR